MARDLILISIKKKKIWFLLKFNTKEPIHKNNFKTFKIYFY